jgi:hypothetical protein
MQYMLDRWRHYGYDELMIGQIVALSWNRFGGSTRLDE